MFRIIYFVKNDSDKESIYITSDLTADADEFCPYGFTLHSDTKCEGDLPSAFPMDYQFNRE
jgi:hypothetical protein